MREAAFQALAPQPLQLPAAAAARPSAVGIDGRFLLGRLVGPDAIMLQLPRDFFNGLLTMSDLLAARDEALRRWEAAGVLDTAISAAVASLKFAIVDLPGSHLGAATNDRRIPIDKNAAGYGWFIDATVSDDAECRRKTESESLALAGSAVASVDLLTVVMHEIGHHFGLIDLYNNTDGRLMSWSIDVGIRRSPIQADAMLVNFLYLYPQGRRRQ